MNSSLVVTCVTEVWLLSQVKARSVYRSSITVFCCLFLTLAKGKAEVSDLSVKVSFGTFYNFLSSKPMDFSMSKAQLRETYD